MEQSDRPLGRIERRAPPDRRASRARARCASSRRGRGRARRAAPGRRRPRSRADRRPAGPRRPVRRTDATTSVGARSSLPPEPGERSSASSFSRASVRGPRTRKRQGLVRLWFGAQRASSRSSSSTSVRNRLRGEHLVRAPAADRLLELHRGQRSWVEGCSDGANAHLPQARVLRRRRVRRACRRAGRPVGRCAPRGPRRGSRPGPDRWAGAPSRPARTRP